MEYLNELVKSLTALQGNVGLEDPVIDWIMQRLEKVKGLELSLDSLGNITAFLPSTKPLKQRVKVMLFGHMDEVGMMVKRIDEDGFIYAEKLGSLNPTCLSGLKLQLLGKQGALHGVVGVKSHHLLQNQDKQVSASVQGIYIDVGAQNRQSVLAAGIEIGTSISYLSQYVELLDYCVANKSMDDRALLAALIYVLETLDPSQLDCDIYGVFSVQEEFNTRGIMPTVRAIEPDIVIGLDVTPATDTPDLKGYSEIKLGKGPALTYMNHHSRGTLAGLVPNRKLLQFIEQVGSDLDVSIQHEVATGILTETAYISIERQKMVVANISLPTRYTHTPVEVISLKDLHDLYRLLIGLCGAINHSTQFGKDIDYQQRRTNI